MRPEGWYTAFWLVMAVAFAIVNFFAVRWAVRDAILQAARLLGWSKE